MMSFFQPTFPSKDGERKYYASLPSWEGCLSFFSENQWKRVVIQAVLGD